MHSNKTYPARHLVRALALLLGALVVLALEEGCLTSLDQKMMDFFPELAGRIRDPRKNAITIRQLLQMRAGYPWEESRLG